MLRQWVRLAAAGLFAAIAVLAAPAPAWAECWEEHQEVCPPQGACRIEVVVVCDEEGEGGNDGGGGGGGGGTNECTWEGQVVECQRAGWGWYNPTDGCYYQMMEPQPDSTSEWWQGADPETSDVYVQRCLPDGGTGFVVLQAPPPGYGGGGGITAEELAQRAIADLPITGPAIGIAPDPAGTGLVGLPVWIWTAETAETWGPVSATASVPGLSVTATATARYIDWSMGDGDTVRCTEPGTPYEGSYGMSESPDCGHRYDRADDYTVTGTTTWDITWTVDGGGASGTLTVTRDSTTEITIEEAQALR